MLVMVVETFRDGSPDRVGERFRERGRMLPEDVRYLESWMTAEGARCYQLMETPTLEALAPWIAAWEDLVEFEVTPVLTSTEYWTKS